jgi:hypothetical protein
MLCWIFDDVVTLLRVFRDKKVVLKSYRDGCPEELLENIKKRKN